MPNKIWKRVNRSVSMLTDFKLRSSLIDPDLSTVEVYIHPKVHNYTLHIH